METLQQQLLITEDKIVTPLVEVLSKTIPKSPTLSSSSDIENPLKKSLDDLFPEQKYEEKNIQQAKQILGSLAESYSREQLKEQITKIQYLAESWIDDFERTVFKGLSLQELLHEKGGT